MKKTKMAPAGSTRFDLFTCLRPALLAAAIGLLTALPGCGGPGIEEAARFTDEAEAELETLGIRSERAAWVQSTYIIHDTEQISAEALRDLVAATTRLGKQATRFENLPLPPELARKLKLIRTSLPLAAPDNPALQSELASLSTEMESIYGSGRYCPENGECRDLGQLSQTLATSRDPDRLLEAWKGWRTVSVPLRDKYQRFAQLANQGAGELGFQDLGDLWRSGYDMPAAEFQNEMNRLWDQVSPLYESLHCYVRQRLSRHYGSSVVPPTGPIPAHLLGNMWSQQWGNIYPLVAPPGQARATDVTALLRKRNLDAVGMVRLGEGFFTSLGMEPLPATFWERSQFVQPADRNVVCHASAWNIDQQDDLRIKMCIQVNEEDFSTIHHELGHNFYQRAYAGQDPLFRTGAHDGFHEGIGDTLALSVTPGYLAQIGLLDEAPGQTDTISFLLKMALDKIAFLPFGLLVDQWRWGVFSGDIPPERYNSAWWELRLRYQGLAPPVSRSEADFDPGAKYHVPANTPYSRYFLAHILQFQFQRSLCQAAGVTGPLHECSIYGSREAGARLQEMLEMGASRPWPDALEVLTGQREMDATAIVDYFQPLQTWLEVENQGLSCGW